MFDFLPSRGKKSESPLTVANLDKVLTQKYKFVLHGKDHILTPPDILTWMQVAEANEKLWALSNQETVKPDEFIEKMFALASKLCPTLTVEDLKNCSQAQVSALWQLILDMLNGTAQKKTLVNLAMQGMTKKDINNLIRVLSHYESIAPSSLPSSQGSTAGPSM